MLAEALRLAQVHDWLVMHDLLVLRFVYHYTFVFLRTYPIANLYAFTYIQLVFTLIITSSEIPFIYRENHNDHLNKRSEAVVGVALVVSRSKYY
jgi:hypothetical protein